MQVITESTLSDLRLLLKEHEKILKILQVWTESLKLCKFIQLTPGPCWHLLL